MKKVSKYVVYISLASLLTGILLGALFFGGSSGKHATHDHNSQSAVADGTIWTCSMHPKIRKSEPGQCPICGMDLIPKEEAGQGSDMDPASLTLSSTAMKLANIQTSKVKYAKPEKTVHLSGKIQVDERRVSNQTAHFPGRIERLYVDFTGQKVRKGQKIASVYSPELVSAQKELLEALKYKEENPSMIKAARQKLRLWKLPEKLISSIEKSGKVHKELPVRADVSGVVLKKNVNLGDHVHEGQVLYEIADLSKVWAVFEAYQSDLFWLSEGDKVKFTVSSMPGKRFTAPITFIDPVINTKTRIAEVRAEVKNLSYRLKPEMFIEGRIYSGRKFDEKTLMIPKSAVLWTGPRSVVYVKVPDRSAPTFQLREVVLKQKLDQFYLIEEGLSHGEKVVTHGAFTVDAAAQLNDKPSMMSSKDDKVNMDH